METCPYEGVKTTGWKPVPLTLKGTLLIHQTERRAASSKPKGDRARGLARPLAGLLGPVIRGGALPMSGENQAEAAVGSPL